MIDFLIKAGAIIGLLGLAISAIGLAIWLWKAL